MLRSLVGSEMCIRDSTWTALGVGWMRRVCCRRRRFNAGSNNVFNWLVSCSVCSGVSRTVHALWTYAICARQVCSNRYYHGWLIRELFQLTGARTTSIGYILPFINHLAFLILCARHFPTHCHNRVSTCRRSVRRALTRQASERTVRVLVAVSPVSYTHLTLPTICSV